MPLEQRRTNCQARSNAREEAWVASPHNRLNGWANPQKASPHARAIEKLAFPVRSTCTEIVLKLWAGDFQMKMMSPNMCKAPGSALTAPCRERNRYGDCRVSYQRVKIPYLSRLWTWYNCWKNQREKVAAGALNRSSGPWATRAPRQPSFREAHRLPPCRSPIRNRKYIQIHGHGPSKRVLHGHWHLSSCHGCVPHMRERDREPDPHATHLQL